MIKGHVVVTDEEGRIVAEADNLTVLAGLACLTNFLAGTNPSPANYIALGTGATAATTADTALEVERVRVPVLLTSFDAPTNVATLVGYVPATSNTYLVFAEAGLFVDSTMLSRVVTPITKTSGRLLRVQWALTMWNG